jgi:hypothetical protein
MKKILIAMTMFAATIGNANAFQFETNNDILVQTIIGQIIQQTVGNTVNTGNVTIHTTGIQTKQKMTKCVSSPQYFSDGTMKMRVKCY